MTLTEQTVLREVERLTLHELRLWVREGWVCPCIGETGPLFDEIDVARLRLLCDLRQDMGLPEDAVPVVLTLLDRLHQARRDLHELVTALGDQPEDVRRAVVARLRARTSEFADRR